MKWSHPVTLKTAACVIALAKDSIHSIEFGTITEFCATTFFLVNFAFRKYPLNHLEVNKSHATLFFIFISDMAIYVSSLLFVSRLPKNFGILQTSKSQRACVYSLPRNNAFLFCERLTKNIRIFIQSRFWIASSKDIPAIHRAKFNSFP